MQQPDSGRFTKEVDDPGTFSESWGVIVVDLSLMGSEYMDLHPDSIEFYSLLVLPMFVSGSVKKSTVDAEVALRHRFGNIAVDSFLADLKEIQGITSLEEFLKANVDAAEVYASVHCGSTTRSLPTFSMADRIPATARLNSSPSFGKVTALRPSLAPQRSGRLECVLCSTLRRKRAE